MILTQEEVDAMLEARESEEECDHEGHVVNGRCEKCGERYESDEETFRKENPR